MLIINERYLYLIFSNALIREPNAQSKFASYENKTPLLTPEDLKHGVLLTREDIDHSGKDDIGKHLWLMLNLR